MNSKQPPSEYDWRVDAYASWLEALAAIHTRLVAEGRVKPRDEADDQAWLEMICQRVPASPGPP